MDELIFHEYWFTVPIRNAANDAWDKVKDLDGSVLEIGSWEGHSTVYLANLVYPEPFIAIDPHAEDSHEHLYFLSLGDKRDTYSVFLHNIKNGTQGNVIHKRMGWQEFFSDWDGKIKFIYVDGPHEQENVVLQLEAIRPRLVKGAIILGDDYGDPEVRDAFSYVFPSTMPHPMSSMTGFYQHGVE